MYVIKITLYQAILINTVSSIGKLSYLVSKDGK